MKLHLGALDENNNYVSPSSAIKSKKYKCPDCDASVIVKQGEIRIHHFAHFVKQSCEYFERPSEAQIHKDGKLAIKHRLETDGFMIERKCLKCKDDVIQNQIPKQDRVELEHRFEHMEQTKIADIACFKDGKRIIFEIFNTHRTDEDDRSGEWYEIKATEVDDKVLTCHRIMKCSTCVFQEQVKEASFLKQMEDLRIQRSKKIEEKQIQRQKEAEEQHSSPELNYKVIEYSHADYLERNTGYNDKKAYDEWKAKNTTYYSSIIKENA